jgi:antitoxin component YwqK of YwqJK toxin-antitoxin module
MKKILLTILPLLLIVGCSKLEVLQDLIPVAGTYRNGNIVSITYHKKSRSGIEKVKYEQYYENGQKKTEESWKDGKLNGKKTRWYENGQKWGEEYYRDGKESGLSTSWDENGQKWKEGTYKDGNKNGKWTELYENGQKKWEGTYKDGKVISSKRWYRNGTERK